MFIYEFREGFQNTPFIELLWGNTSFIELHVQVAEFQPTDAVKNYFADTLQAFYTRTRSSHLKAFIYLKFLKTVYEEVHL